MLRGIHAFRFGTRSWFIVTPVIAVALLLCVATHQAHHRWYYQHYSLYESFLALSAIRNGDSVENVAKHFHTAELADDHLSWDWPIEEGDQFMAFSFGSQPYSVLLQFRRGKVVNHPSTGYANVPLIARANNISIPSIVHRQGGWILCVSILLVAIPVACMAKRWATLHGFLLLHIIICTITYVTVSEGYTFNDGVIEPLSLSLLILPPTVAIAVVFARREPRFRKILAVTTSCGLSLIQYIIIMQYVPNRFG